jgi:hypothetical protein
MGPKAFIIIFFLSAAANILGCMVDYGRVKVLAPVISYPLSPADIPLFAVPLIISSFSS